MFLCNRWPRMTFPPMVLGTMIEAIGVGLLGYAIWTENRATVFGMMALVGYGAGLRYMVGPLHGVGLFHEHRAAIIGLLAVANPFGGTLGLTIMSAVFNNVSGLDSDDGDFSQIRNGPEETMDEAIYNAKVRYMTRKVSTGGLTEHADGGRLGIRGYYAAHGTGKPFFLGPASMQYS